MSQRKSRLLNRIRFGIDVLLYNLTSFFERIQLSVMVEYLLHIIMAYAV